MEIQSGKHVDLLYALFLGRMPEDNFVREHNLGLPALGLVKEIITSEEFRLSVLERFLSFEDLPHRGLSLRLLPDVLEFIADAQLVSPNNGPMTADWKSVLGRVLADTPCRAMVEEALETEGHRLIERLNVTRLSTPDDSDVVPPDRALTPAPDIVSGVDVVANTICRGWLVDRAAPGAPLHIKIKLNGGVVKVLLADEFRRDVQDLYGGEGRAGFTIRLDLLPDARFLSRATIEIAELISGAVVLPERVVEFSVVPALRIEAELRDEVSSIRDYLHRLEKSLNHIEKELSQFWNKNNWALSQYSIVRSVLKLVMEPPKIQYPVTFSLLIIHNRTESNATATTLASVLGQTLKPAEVFLIAPADALIDFTPSGAAAEVVRLEPDQLPMEAANSVAARAKGSYLLILDSGVVALAPEALAWLAAAIEQTNAPIVYTDGEIAARSKHGSEYLRPLFRPAFDYDLLLQRNYIGKAFCIERHAYMALAGFSCSPMVDAHHDFLLRTVTRFGRGAFMHLPLVLVSDRAAMPSDEQDPVRHCTMRTVQTHLDQLATGAQAVAHADPFGRTLSDAVKIQWRNAPTARISVVIPTQDRADMVFALISSLRRHAAAWDRIEIVVVVNGDL
jgi:O-antigen biosynthesis protein